MTTKIIQDYIKKQLISPKERLSVWLKAVGMWARRKPEPIRELKKIRRSLERL